MPQQRVFFWGAVMSYEKLVATLKDDEGYRQFVYDDTEGFKTIGYGTMIEPGGQGVSRAAAEFMMRERIDSLYAELSVYEWFAELNPARQRAIANMAYQMGVAGVLGFRKMIAALKREDWAQARYEALDSKWHKQTPNRAHRVAGVILTGLD